MDSVVVRDRNKKLRHWYVGKKSYTLPITIAKDGGRAIATAAKGKPFAVTKVRSHRTPLLRFISGTSITG